jgi:hypothetical protein
MTTPSFRTLKALRMWHWQQMKTHRAEQDRLERLVDQSTRAHHKKEYREEARQHRMLADLHLSAVQVLNDSVPGTAEQDCAEEDAQKT